MTKIKLTRLIVNEAIKSVSIRNVKESFKNTIIFQITLFMILIALCNKTKQH